MPDPNPLAAILVAQQRHRVDPVEQQRKYAQLLMQQGSSMEPVRTPLQGLARALTGGVGGVFDSLAEREQKSNEQQDIQGIAGMLGAKTNEELTAAAQKLRNPDFAAPLLAQMLAHKQEMLKASDEAAAFRTSVTPPPPGTQSAGPPGAPGQIAAAPLPAPAQQGSADPALNAIAGIETKGQPNGGYDAIGPVADAKGSRAHGRYQVMDYNVGPWTQEVLGKAMTPDEFRANPQAQDIVAKTKFGQLQQKYGDRAASAWFAGENGMNNPNAKDVNGTTVSGYQQQFAQNGGAAVPPQGGDLPPAPGAARGDGSGNQVPPAQSTVPDVPRPPYNPDSVKKYTDLVDKRLMKPEDARKALDAENLQEWQYLRENRRMEWTQKQQQEQQQQKAAIELNQTAPITLIKDRMQNYENKVRPAAMAAVGEIPIIHQARQILDAGAFTGTGAEAKTFLAKLGEQMGIPSDQAQNTQVLGSVLAKRTLAAAGGTLGTGFSNADRDFMELASGGKTSLDEGAIRHILDIGERQAKQTISQHDTEVKRLSKVPGVAQLGEDYLKLPEAPDYKTWSAANPLQGGTAAPPGQPAPAQRGAPADGATATNPQTKQKVILRGGQWVPLQ